MDVVFPQVSQRRLWQVFITSCTLVLKIQIWLPGDFTLVDLQAPLGHVSHPLLALLAGVHGQVMDVRSLICHFKVADAAVALSRRWESQRVRQRQHFIDWLIDWFLMICWESNLSAEVDDSSVGVIKRQKDATAGVQLLQGQGLAKVVLLKMIETDSRIHTRGLIHANPVWNNALALVKQWCKNKSIKAGCPGKLQSGVSILMKAHRKGKITACGADLIGFYGTKCVRK